MWRERLESAVVRVALVLLVIVAGAGAGWYLRGAGGTKVGPVDPGVIVEPGGSIIVETGGEASVGQAVEVFVPAATCSEAIDRLEVTIFTRLSESNTPLPELTQFDQNLLAARDLCSYNTYRQFVATYAPTYLDLRTWREQPDPIPSFEEIDGSLGSWPLIGVPQSPASTTPAPAGLPPNVTAPASVPARPSGADGAGR